MSQHVQVLKQSGLLEERRDGTRRLYRVSPATVRDLRAFLDGLWGEGLVRLKAELEGGAGGGDD